MDSLGLCDQLMTKVPAWSDQALWLRLYIEGMSTVLLLHVRYNNIY